MRCCSRSSASAHTGTAAQELERRTRKRVVCALTAIKNEDTMTARQFLLTESTYCRERAAGCADRFIAEELRRLAEEFERTAAAMELATRDKIRQNAR